MNFVIVDDYPIAVHGLKSLISLQKNNTVVGEAYNVKQAVEVILKECPDISFINIDLNGGNGIDIIDRIKDRSSCKFIIMTQSENQFDFNKMDYFNIDGCITRKALLEEVLYAINLVSKGRKYYDPILIENNLQLNKYSSAIDRLTSREKEVLRQLEKGLTNSQIADNLFITPNTVKKHISQILSKLNLKGRTQAALFSINKKYKTSQILKEVQL